MNRSSIFLDTVFIHALLNRRDQYHRQALELFPKVQAANVWVTEAILTEVANGLSAVNRVAAVQFIRQCYSTPNLTVISIDTSLLARGIDLYASRPDKTWGLTDCLSFVVMQDYGLMDAATADEHFLQAGFRALLLIENENFLHGNSWR